MQIDLDKLAEFLIKAKRNTYAGEGKEIVPERHGFKELEYTEGDWSYRDSYAGFFFAPGQEIVRYQGQPAWVMAYSGGMKPDYHRDIKFAKETFTFLKKALTKVEKSNPYRGPKSFNQESWQYQNRIDGSIEDFKPSRSIRSTLHWWLSYSKIKKYRF